MNKASEQWVVRTIAGADREGEAVGDVEIENGGNGKARAVGKAVTVFGGSRVVSGSTEYGAAVQLGRMLANRGFVVCNGGYSGTMEATHRGAKEACGRTIGCTVALLSSRLANPWVDEEQRSETLLHRLDRLTVCADAFVVLRGGIGTLLELAFVWNVAQLDATFKKPIVVVGRAWQEVVASMARELQVRLEDLAAIHSVESVEDAVELVCELLACRANGG